MKAVLLLRDSPHYRPQLFRQGLEKVGFKVVTTGDENLTKEDVVVIWNRYGRYHEFATRAERRGARVLVAENGYLGITAPGGPWYALAGGRHNGAGAWPHGPCAPAGAAARLAPLGLRCLPWHPPGGEVVLLPQRGIGTPGVAMPADWESKTMQKLQSRYPGVTFRTRKHPGQHESVPLADDLKNASAVVTWASGAAIKAITLGVPAFYMFEQWIGRNGAAHLRDFPERLCDDEARQHMLEDVIWGMWSGEEVSSGLAFEHLLRMTTC